MHILLHLALWWILALREVSASGGYCSRLLFENVSFSVVFTPGTIILFYDSPSLLPHRSALTWVTLFCARACLCMSTIQYSRWWYAPSLFANHHHTRGWKRERKLLFMFAIVQVQNTLMESTLLLYLVSCFFVCIYSVQPSLFWFKSEGQIADPLPCLWAWYMYAWPWLLPHHLWTAHLCSHLSNEVEFEVRHARVQTQAHCVRPDLSILLYTNNYY